MISILMLLAIVVIVRLEGDRVLKRVEKDMKLLREEFKNDLDKTVRKICMSKVEA